MGASAAGRVVLMAIHPAYAEAILEGRKHVEFRKRPLADNVTAVMIYATTPVREIVGEFAVDETVSGSPQELWRLVGSRGAIDGDAYDAYYAGATSAAGIMVRRVVRYARPVLLAELEPTPAVPQSFIYLQGKQVDRVRLLGLKGEVRAHEVHHLTPLRVS